jgi:tetratricopeptide (TPR) repeat protein
MLRRLPTNTLRRTELIGQACSFSLLHRDAIAKKLSIHRQVQAVLRDMMAEKGEEGVWAESAVRAMSRAFPDPKEFSTWSMCETMLPHALSCAESISHFDMEFWEAALLLSRSGFYLEARARYREAEPLYQRALAILEKTLDPEDPVVASSLNNLAELYRAQGQYAKAEPFYERTLAIREKTLGPEHPVVATSLNNLALLYKIQGQYGDAEPLYQRALAIVEKALGLEHPDVATCLENYALCLRAMDRSQEAEPMESRARAIRAKRPD